MNTKSLLKDKTKLEKIQLQAWLASGVKQGVVDRYLSQGQIVEFTNPEFTYANVEFSINNDRNQKIWFSQLNLVIVHINDNGDFLGFELSSFPVNGTEKRLWDISAQDFWEIVKGKKYKVSSTQSYVLNRTSRTIHEKGLDNYYEFAMCVK